MIDSACVLILFSDKQYIVKKCPYLINEMVNIVAQLVALAHGGRGEHVSQTFRGWCLAKIIHFICFQTHDLSLVCSSTLPETGHCGAHHEAQSDGRPGPVGQQVASSTVASHFRAHVEAFCHEEGEN